MKDKFAHQTLESVQFGLESVEKPKIKAGASSSSNILNRFLDAQIQDLTLQAARASQIALRADRIALAMDSQALAMTSLLETLSTRVNSASAYSQVFADMASQTYINTGSTTADLNAKFNQATLPIRSTTDLLIQTDVYGNPMVYSQVSINYAFGETAPSSEGFILSQSALEMIKELEPWVNDPVGQPVWIVLKADLQFRGLTPNVLEFSPFPAWGHDLVSVEYQRAGESFTGTWIALDLSYLPFYSDVTGQVPMVASVRLHLPNEAITQIRIKLRPRSANVPWGLHSLKLYHREYENTATLVVLDPYSRTIGTTVIRGKDPSSLSLLQKTTSGSQTTINLTTTDTSTTPVITGVIMSVS